MQADVFRFIFYVVGITAIAAELPVIALYLTNWLQSGRDQRRLVPAHVITVALSQIVFITSAAWGSLANLHDPYISDRVYFYIGGCVLSTVAMFLMGIAQRRERRVYRHRVELNKNE